MAQKQMNSEESSTTERELAPGPSATYSTPVRPPLRVERTGSSTEPFTRRLPQVRGGVCEYCGIIDPNTPSQYQYRLCSHFRGMSLMCSYCPDTKSPDEVVRQETLNIAEHPSQPGVLVVWCGSFECSSAHITRFKINR